MLSDYYCLQRHKNDRYSIAQTTTYIVDVTEVDAFQHLPHNSSYSLLIESRCTLVKIIQYGVVDELKDQVQVLLATKHFYQVHQVLVS